MMNKTFVYIAALRRTGSTLLAEILSVPPYSFIFREPRIAKGNLIVKQPELDELKKFGIDLAVLRKNFLKRHAEDRAGFFEKAIKTGPFHSFCLLGIKEIHHHGWEKIYQVFPEMKVILIGRDPRDIYFSLNSVARRRQKLKEKPLKLLGKRGIPVTPGNVAQDLLKEFAYQEDIFNKVPSIKIKYEDVCTQPKEIIANIKQFLGYEGFPTGKSGQYSLYNQDIHGDEITATRLGRWKNEGSARLRDEAHQVFQMMHSYCDFWRYE
jgi:hypothetical protein